MEAQHIKLIFVAGVPRSGTTLVQNILDCHPDIYGGPEFDRIPNIIDLRRKLNMSLKWGRINSFTTRAEVDVHMANLIKNLLHPVARRNHCSFISEKTPWNILAFEDLIEILPEAKFIHLIRYPHAVIASMRGVAARALEKGILPPDFTKSIGLACYYYESVLKLIHRLDKKYPGKILTIKYENLLNEPPSEIKRLCSFIGVTFDKKMLTPEATAHPGEKQMTKNKVWYSESMYRSKIDMSNINKWEFQLNGTDKAFINYVFLHNPHIKKYGYSFSNKELSHVNRYFGKLRFNKYRKTHDFSRIPFRTMG